MLVSCTVGLCFGAPPVSDGDSRRESSVLPPPKQHKCGCTPKSAPPGRLSKSQRQFVATLRFNPLLGPLRAVLTAPVHP